MMKQAEFADAVLESKILTPEEVITIFRYNNSTSKSPLEFSDSVRCGFHDDNIHRCGRFKYVSGNGWGYGSGYGDGFNFTADKDIMSHGLSLFGSENNDYSATLTIKQTSPKLTLAFKTGTFSSKLSLH